MMSEWGEVQASPHSFLSTHGGRLTDIRRNSHVLFWRISPSEDSSSIFPHLLGVFMRLVEEVYTKAKEDLICQSCGIDIPAGSNHLLESYVHHGNISTSHYCLNKKCNPPNNVRLRLFWGSIIVVLSSWVIYLSFFN